MSKKASGSTSVASTLAIQGMSRPKDSATAVRAATTGRSGIPTTSTESQEPEEGREDSTEPAHKRERKRRLDVDPAMIISEGRSKRRRTPSPGPDEQDKGEDDLKDPARAKLLGMQIYEKIMKKKDSKGEMMHEPFVKLPSKRALPDYYETIKHPISLEIIHDKLQASGYETLREVCIDLGQMFTNAKRYNIKESVIFQYAKRLHKMTRTFYADATSRQTQMQEHPDSESEQEREPSTTFQRGTASQSVEVDAGPEEEPEGEEEHGEETAPGSGVDLKGRRVRKRGSYMKDGPSVYKLIKPVVRAIKELKSSDGRGRAVAAIFLDLPDRQEFPDYYKAIKLPISLNEIESKMIARTYGSPDQFYEDVELMCNNAMFYNEDGSMVYNDAQQIKGLLEFWKGEIKDRLSRPQQPKPVRLKASSMTPLRLSNIAASQSTPQYMDPRPLPPAISNYSYSSPYPYGTMPVTATASGSYPPPPQAIRQPPIYPTYPPPIPTPSHLHMQEPGRSPIPNSTPTKPYLPALPQGVVTEEIVSSLSRYPSYEQQAWISSLPPHAKQMLHQFQATIEARAKRIVSTAGLNFGSTSSSTALGEATSLNGEKRKPLDPAIKYMDLGFSNHSVLPPAVSFLTNSEGTSPNPPTTTNKNIIRLLNKRGILTHAMVVGPEMSEIEVTAYISDVSLSKKSDENEPPSTTMTAGGDATIATSLASTSSTSTSIIIPEVSLRVNGIVASLPQFVYAPTVPQGSAPPEAEKQISSMDGETLKELEDENVIETQTDMERRKDKEMDKEKPKPIGMRWVVGFNKALSEGKIEIVASKPGVEVETSIIYLNRQY